MLKQDRHAIVNAPREIIGASHDQCAARNRLAREWVFPLIPKTGDRKHGTIRRADKIGLLAAAGRAPLVIAGLTEPEEGEGKAENDLALNGSSEAPAGWDKVESGTETETEAATVEGESEGQARETVAA
jgi:hypothetical protein